MRSVSATFVTVLIALSASLSGIGAADAGQTDSARQQPASLWHPWSAEGNQELAEFGTSVSTAGDVEGDGFDDVIVGADRYDNGRRTKERPSSIRGPQAGPGRGPSGRGRGTSLPGCSVCRSPRPGTSTAMDTPT
jgi:FG-GAP repeat